MGAAGPAARREEGEYSPYLTDEQRSRRAGSARFGDGRLSPRAARVGTTTCNNTAATRGPATKIFCHRSRPSVEASARGERQAPSASRTSWRTLSGHSTGTGSPTQRTAVYSSQAASSRDAHVGDEGEVQVQPLAAGGVLLVADQAGRRAVDAQPRREGPLEAGLLAQLAAGRLERRLARLDLAADGEPQLEALVAHEQDLPAVPAEDGDGERAPVGHARITSRSGRRRPAAPCPRGTRARRRRRSRRARPCWRRRPSSPPRRSRRRR